MWRRRGAAGKISSRSATRGTTSSSTNRGSPRISCGATGAAPAACDSAITRRAGTRRRRRSIADLRWNGLHAPAVFDGPIDNPTFLAYVEQVLVPTLRAGDVVVLDKLAVHKQAEVQTAIEASAPSSASCRPYNPDFNPIELAFAKLKAFLRAPRPGSFDQVVDLMAIAIGLFTPQECTNFVRHWAIASLQAYEKRSSADGVAHSFRRNAPLRTVTRSASYPSRRASVGSTRTARRAGPAADNSPMVMMKMAAAGRIHGMCHPPSASMFSWR
jgi:hypothetical protein